MTGRVLILGPLAVSQAAEVLHRITYDHPDPVYDRDCPTCLERAEAVLKAAVEPAPEGGLQRPAADSLPAATPARQEVAS